MSETNKAAVEVMARAIAGCEDDEVFSWHNSYAQSALDAYHAHLEDAGLVIVPGWQPIETAPRDGTVIALGVIGRSLGEGFWSNWNNYWTSGELDRMRDHLLLMPQPTHWMPLPAPPMIAAKGEG